MKDKVEGMVNENAMMRCSELRLDLMDSKIVLIDLITQVWCPVAMTDEGMYSSI